MATKRPRAYSPGDSPCYQEQRFDEVMNLVSELHQTVTTAQRHRVLDKILRKSPSFANSLVQGGAVQALCLQLGFVLSFPYKSRGPESEVDQITMIFHVLGSLYQNCSERIREDSIDQIGRQILHVSIQVWKQSTNAPELLRHDRRSSLLSIWTFFSLSSAGSALLLEQEDFLYLLQSQMISDKDQHESVTKDINHLDNLQRQEKVYIILKHITHHSESYRLTIFEQFGTILSRLATALDLEQSSLERLASIFRNLALTSRVRVAMVENSHVISALLQLLLRFSNFYPYKQHAKAARTLLCTLGTLCLETDACLLLILHGDGMILSILFQYLRSAQVDEVIRRRSARALRLLSQSKATVAVLVTLKLATYEDEDSDFLTSLYQVARHDPCLNVRTEATMAYAQCVAYAFTEKSPLGEETFFKRLDQIMNNLVELSQKVPTAAEPLAETFQNQVKKTSSEKSRDVRVIILRHPSYLKAITDLALRPNSSRLTYNCITSSLICLARDESLDRDMLVTEPVLNCLVHMATNSESAGQEQREAAVQALVELSSSTSRSKEIVTHGGLLHALIRYTTGCIDGNAKENVKKTLLSRLIPEL
mmetsp:Transcript_6055/g.9604  ORF Transcript_6055/g.9604 Transcript_6055/m.9604 type:complete len:595 (-) Transcript_6055:1278-3062(-)